MELLEPLKEEMSENFELAKATENLIRNERDMLMGQSEERIVLFTLSTHVWDSVINSGQLSHFEEASREVAKAYRSIHEVNTVMEKFNRFGGRIMYTPLLNRGSGEYDRENLLDIIAEMCAEVSSQVMAAQDQLDQVIQTECPACGRRFSSRKAMKSHITQKDDPDHEAIRERIR